MRTVRTVVLRHERPGGGHYDWLLERPTPAGDGALATWRLRVGPGDWPTARRLWLRPLGDHRRAYLHREGPLSGGRGWVRRVDAGWAVVRLWTPGRIVVDLRMGRFVGRVRVQWHGPAVCSAIAEATTAGDAGHR